HGVEDLRYAATLRGGAAVQHFLAGKRLGQLLDLFDQRAADQVPVIAECLVPDADRLKQGLFPWWRGTGGAARPVCRSRAIIAIPLSFGVAAQEVDSRQPPCVSLT